MNKVKDDVLGVRYRLTWWMLMRQGRRTAFSNEKLRKLHILWLKVILESHGLYLNESNHAVRPRS
jgi:hypothetical protein